LPLLYLSFTPLLLCSCVEEAKEREREERADWENHGCRSCPPISISADDNCPSGHECNPDWKLTTNILIADDCLCSEVKCADRTATLAVSGETVGRIRCKDQQWTLLLDSSITTESAVCAKGCGPSVCKHSHPKAPKEGFTALAVIPPSKKEKCASAECPYGIASFDDDGSHKDTLSESSLVCSSSGKWKIGGGEERYAMCKNTGLRTIEEMPVSECTKIMKELHPDTPDIACKVGIVEIENSSITCPEGSLPFALGYDDSTTEWTDLAPFDSIEWDSASNQWLFKSDGSDATIGDLEGELGSTIKLACIIAN
ncbi:hypothetical protein PMAYCL1PPCAC_03849, partial [Pristionchus mayeri]